MSLEPAVINLTIVQGATFEEPFQFLDDNDDPLDLTDCTARCHLRSKIADVDPVLELTTENGRIAIDELTATVTLTIAAEDTAEIQRSGVYDLEVIFPDTTVSRLIKGLYKLDPEVTR